VGRCGVSAGGGEDAVAATARRGAVGRRVKRRNAHAATSKRGIGKPLTRADHSPSLSQTGL